MNTPTIDSPSYGLTKHLASTSFDRAVQLVTEGLKREGFGVLTEIDVKATLKRKLDVDFRRYTILGACNPALAHQALSAEPLVGLLLPCNVVVAENDGGSTISVVNPREMFRIVENAELETIVAEVDAKIRRVVEGLEP